MKTRAPFSVTKAHCAIPSSNQRPIAANNHLAKGHDYTSKQKYKEAVAEYNYAITCDPSCLDAYYSKGCVLNELHQYQEAINTFNALIHRDTDQRLYHKALSRQGVAWSGMGRDDLALMFQDQSIAVKPTVAAYCHKGALLYKLGNRDEDALYCFNQAKIMEFSVSSPNSATVSHTVSSIGAKGFKLHVKEMEKVILARDTLRKKMLEFQDVTMNAQKVVGSLSDDDITIAPPAVSEAVLRFKSLITKSKQVTKDTVSTLAKPKAVKDLSEKKVLELERQMEAMQMQMESLSSTLQDAGVYEIAKLKKEFASLDSEILTYSTTFYWSVINLIGAYRHIGTKLIDGNPYSEDSSVEGVLVAGAKKAASVATEFAKNIPFVGCIVSILDKVVQVVYETYKKKQLQNKVDAVNNVVERKFITEEEVSKSVAKLALKMADHKKEEIKSEDKSDANDINGWIMGAIMSLLGQEDSSKPYGARLALKDAALFMAHLFSEHDAIVSSPLTFSEQIPTIAMYVAKIEIKKEDSDSVAALTQSEQSSLESSITPAEVIITSVFSAEDAKSTETRQESVSHTELIAINQSGSSGKLEIVGQTDPKVDVSSWCCC